MLRILEIFKFCTIFQILLKKYFKFFTLGWITDEVAVVATRLGEPWTGATPGPRWPGSTEIQSAMKVPQGLLTLVDTGK